MKMKRLQTEVITLSHLRIRRRERGTGQTVSTDLELGRPLSVFSPYDEGLGVGGSSSMSFEIVQGENFNQKKAEKTLEVIVIIM